MPSSSTDTINLDFAATKNSLKNYLKSQNKFLDYDFEGSNLSVLLDLLAYNSTNNAFLLNMAMNEAFLDSSALRESVLSHAKILNYLPNSRKSSSAVVDISIDTTGFSKPDTLVIPKGTEFVTVVLGKPFTFTTASSVVMVNTDPSTAVFDAVGVTLFEGKYITNNFLATGNKNEKFLISSENVDLSSLEMVVKNSVSDATTKIWNYSSSLLGLKSTDEVFYLQPTGRKNFEIVIGDDAVSKALVANNVVTISYRISKGKDAATGGKSFKATGSIQGFSSGISVTATSQVSGGSERESITSIKQNAPKHFQTQERAITSSDYETILTKQFPEIQTLAVFGGENLNPPQYGKVAIAIDLTNSNGISDVTKAAITNFIKTKAPISISPIIMDPEFIFFQLSIEVKYDISKTSKTSNDIKSLVVAALTNHNNQTINKFNSTLKSSNLTGIIDGVDTSVVSSSLMVSPFITLSPQTGSLLPPVTLKFFNEIKQTPALTSNLVNDYIKYEAPVKSDGFISNGTSVFLEDDGNGTIQTVTLDSSGNKVVINANTGIVDYLIGEVSLNSLQIDSFTGNGINVFMRPKNSDFAGTQNKILSLDPNYKIMITSFQQS